LSLVNILLKPYQSMDLCPAKQQKAMHTIPS